MFWVEDVLSNDYFAKEFFLKIGLHFEKGLLRLLLTHVINTRHRSGRIDEPLAVSGPSRVDRVQ